MNNPTLLSEIQERLQSINRERWFRWMVRGREHTPSTGFFDAYPQFAYSSKTPSSLDRLNQRHRALIEFNKHLIAGQNVLDIASHDGRWSLAAHKAGAKYVLGIEARQHLVESARKTMNQNGVPSSRVEFVEADVMTELDRIEVGRFDTIFCLGFFYHTLDHMLLLRKISRLQPTNLVMDTAISSRLGSSIQLRMDSIEFEGNAVVGDSGDPTQGIVGTPSREALEMMLGAGGFSKFRYYDWHNAGIKRWDDLKSEYMGLRVSLTAIHARDARSHCTGVL